MRLQSLSNFRIALNNSANLLNCLRLYQTRIGMRSPHTRLCVDVEVGSWTCSEV
ncbi:hypothetical protein [Chroococcidiopsis sp.]|uniref:hypothetical protein n=1 Tax=Chroococcidiopsis sp. TaxID=3088168 RepID=UPI003F35619E